MRRARGRGSVGDAYRNLRGLVRESAVMQTNNMGRWIGGGPARLMMFDTDDMAVAHVRRHHRNEEVREVVPADYAGLS